MALRARMSASAAQNSRRNSPLDDKTKRTLKRLLGRVHPDRFQASHPEAAAVNGENLSAVNAYIMRMDEGELNDRLPLTFYVFDVDGSIQNVSCTLPYGRGSITPLIEALEKGGPAHSSHDERSWRFDVTAPLDDILTGVHWASHRSNTTQAQGHPTGQQRRNHFPNDGRQDEASTSERYRRNVGRNRRRMRPHSGYWQRHGITSPEEAVKHIDAWYHFHRHNNTEADSGGPSAEGDGIDEVGQEDAKTTEILSTAAENDSVSHVESISSQSSSFDDSDGRVNDDLTDQKMRVNELAEEIRRRHLLGAVYYTPAAEAELENEHLVAFSSALSACSQELQSLLQGFSVLLCTTGGAFFAYTGDEHVLTLPISKSKDMYELEFRATAPNEIRRKLDKEKGMVQSQRSSAMRLAAMTRTSRCWVSPQVCPERLWRFEDKVLSIHERCNVLLPRQVLPITLCLYPCDDVSWAEPFMCSRLEGGRAVVGYSEKERSVVASVECSPQTLLRFLKAEWASLMTLGGERGSA